MFNNFSFDEIDKESILKLIDFFDKFRLSEIKEKSLITKGVFFLSF